MADHILSEENVQKLFAYLEEQLDACGCEPENFIVKENSRGSTPKKKP